MKNRLECAVSSCRHYRDDLCCLSAIQVDGPGAGESRQTCCGSFEPRTGTAENALGGPYPTPDAAIRCDAERCAYNNAHRCSAEWVCVGSSRGAAASKAGTECRTFLPK